MRTFQEKLDSLSDSSVWTFTKQDVSFDNAFRAAQLFNSIPDYEHTPIQKYFSDHYLEYGISSNNYRVLVMAQLFGLITKGEFYERGSGYKNERVTPVFELLNSCDFGGTDYNIYKSEQLLKLKIHAIIDSANNNPGWEILPVPFLFQVLYKLKKEHGISQISTSQYYTYVATCQLHEELDEAVKFIAEGAPDCNYVQSYDGFSRAKILIRDNLSLFTFQGDNISLNSDFADDFYEQFFKNADWQYIYSQLHRDIDYADFLYNYQGFCVNLIEAKKTHKLPSVRKKAMPTNKPEIEDDDQEYNEAIADIDDSNINLEISKNAHTVEPQIGKCGNRKQYSKNPLLGKCAIKLADYKCQMATDHSSFLSGKTRKPYMEAHHLIPICFQQEMWDKYRVNIDCVENLISLCPTCHKAIHYGAKEVKIQLLEELYKMCTPKYRSIGLNISLKEMKDLYDI
ncbi:MAG: HNH endonuclease [Clostridia bacterium]|nr:HNH endonuclease [Clostridia bacterium]